MLGGRYKQRMRSNARTEVRPGWSFGAPPLTATPSQDSLKPNAKAGFYTFDSLRSHVKRDPRMAVGVRDGLLVLTLGWLSISTSGCQKNPYQMQKAWQEQQAKHLKPEALDEGGPAKWERFRKRTIRVYADAEFARRAGNLRRYFGDWLERANQVLAPALQLRLEVEELRELPATASSDDLDRVLVSLAELDPGKDVDLVLALIGKSPILTSSFHDLGRAQLLGKYMAVRAMDDAAELQALHEGLDKIDDAERARLYAQRKRHKETAVLLHELAHTLGALHTVASDDLMHPSYDSGMVGFSEPNVVLMRYALDELTADEEARDPDAFLKRIETYVAQLDWRGWVEEDRKFHLESLEAALGRGRARSVAAASEVPQPTAAATEDLTPLSAADRDVYLDLERQRREYQWNEAFKAVTALAERYPTSLPVQQKACELGMQFSVGLAHIKPHCDRMNQLLATPK